MAENWSDPVSTKEISPESKVAALGGESSGMGTGISETGVSTLAIKR
jgi:hypothetical protein